MYGILRPPGIGRHKGFFVSPCMVAHTLNTTARDMENLSFWEKISGAHKVYLRIHPDMNISLMNSVGIHHLLMTICFRLHVGIDSRGDM